MLFVRPPLGKLPSTKTLQRELVPFKRSAAMEADGA
jgi:hypothetical protein